MVQCSRQKQISLKIIPLINVWIDYLKSLNLLLFALRAMHWNSLCSLRSLQWKVFFFSILKNFSAGLRHPIAWT